MGLESLSNGLSTADKISLGVGATGILVGAGLVASSLSGSSGSKSKRSRSRNGRSRDRKFISKQKHEQRYKKRRKSAGKYYKSKSRKKRSGKVYYAKKTGQPYILLSSGKAKFIKGKRRKR